MQTRGKQFAISQITCLEQTLPPPVKGSLTEHILNPSADEANKLCGTCVMNLRSLYDTPSIPGWAVLKL